jgi:DNA-binding GntR family transcriptional regulator
MSHVYELPAYDPVIKLPSVEEIERIQKQHRKEQQLKKERDDAKFLEANQEYLEGMVQKTVVNFRNYLLDTAKFVDISNGLRMTFDRDGLEDVLRLLTENREVVKTYMEKRVNELSPAEYIFTIRTDNKLYLQFHKQPTTPPTPTSTCVML